MSKWIAYLQLIPMILKLVPAFEDAFPIPQSGKDKLNLFLELAGTAWDAAKGAMGHALSKDEALAFIPTAVGIVVKALNALGVFKTSTPAAG